MRDSITIFAEEPRKYASDSRQQCAINIRQHCTTWRGCANKKGSDKKHDQKVIVPREPANGAKAKRFDLRERSPEAGAQSRAVEALVKRLAVPPLRGWPQGRELPYGGRLVLKCRSARVRRRRLHLRAVQV